MTTVTLTNEELEVLMASLPNSWTEEGKHPQMKKLKNKLFAASRLTCPVEV